MPAMISSAISSALFAATAIGFAGTALTAATYIGAAAILAAPIGLSVGPGAVSIREFQESCHG